MFTKNAISYYPTYQIQCLAFPKKIIDKTGGTKTTLKKRIYTEAWNNVCVENDQGSLGIHNPPNQNQALLTKLAYKMINNEDMLWVKTLKPKYYPNTNP